MSTGSKVEAEVRYLVLPATKNPHLLARVRWPDVAQGISAGRPYWQDDPGLFDLPYDPNCAEVTLVEAASIAAGWGVQLHSGAPDSVISFIRRMPANWSNLVPAERRAWSVDYISGQDGLVAREGRLRSLFRIRGRSSPELPLEVAEQVVSLDVAFDKLSLDQIRHRAAENNGGTRHPATERRRHARVQVYGRAQISLGERGVAANLVNVSQGGVHCVVPNSRSLVEFGDELQPPLLLEDEISRSRVRLDVASNVTWRKEIGPGTQLGVGFAELDSEHLERVQRFLVTVGAERSF